MGDRIKVSFNYNKGADNDVLTMKLLKDRLAVCRLNNKALIPSWAEGSNFFSITRTLDELSIVCLEDNVPDKVQCEKDWRALKVEGPLDFSLVGILSSISTILAENEISIFAISTYDTDYILIQNKQIQKAIDVLSSERYKIIE